MGLMYIFPVSENEGDRVEIKEDKTIILKTFGLPYIFWGYLAAGLIVLASMWLASRSTLDKLISYQDKGLVALGLMVKFTLILTPIILLGFFFYEKQIKKSGNKLKLIYKIFFIPVAQKTILLDSSEALSVNHFMDSPNMAKIYNKTELKAFENRGYFELKAKSAGVDILIDRHSRKADLLKLKDLLDRY
ncbi:MAG: hypothetical protein KBD76_00845 [Bacteriovorax sp.]|nr:hypothetical protein [Bacteriovorax sp.]